MAMENIKSLRILIVDDEEPFRNILSNFFIKEVGYKVETAETGEEALERLKQKFFDVIVLDYKMPGISGLNVLQWIHEQKMDTPVLMLTGAGTETVAVEAMKLGAYDYLRKEYVDVDHLPIVINGIHERYQFRKEKEKRELIERERSKNIASIKTFHDTVTAIGLVVNNALAMMSLDLQEYAQDIESNVTEDSLPRVREAFAELKQQYSAIALSVRSMLTSADILHEKFTLKRPRAEENEISKEVQHNQEIQSL